MSPKAGFLCKKHGALKPADIYTYPDGKETKCRICGREYMNSHRDKQKAQKAEKSGVIPGKHSIAAYTIYRKTTLEPEEIVLQNDLWERWGFQDPVLAAEKLVGQWVANGIPTRDGEPFGRRSTTRVRGLCTGCSTPIDRRTYGCKKCSDRHRWRAKRGKPHLTSEFGRVPVTPQEPS